jgi:hypothetical protein
MPLNNFDNNFGPVIVAITPEDGLNQFLFDMLALAGSDAPNLRLYYPGTGEMTVHHILATIQVKNLIESWLNRLETGTSMFTLKGVYRSADGPRELTFAIEPANQQTIWRTLTLISLYNVHTDEDYPERSWFVIQMEAEGHGSESVELKCEFTWYNADANQICVIYSLLYED